MLLPFMRANRGLTFCLTVQQRYSRRDLLRRAIRRAAGEGELRFAVDYLINNIGRQENQAIHAPLEKRGGGV